MEEELNYLSEKVEGMESDENLEGSNELMLLRNILIYITSHEIDHEVNEEKFRNDYPSPTGI